MSYTIFTGAFGPGFLPLWAVHRRAQRGEPAGGPYGRPDVFSCKAHRTSASFRELVAPLLRGRAKTAEVGDQGATLQLMGLGFLLGVWELQSPDP